MAKKWIETVSTSEFSTVRTVLVLIIVALELLSKTVPRVEVFNFGSCLSLDSVFVLVRYGDCKITDIGHITAEAAYVTESPVRYLAQPTPSLPVALRSLMQHKARVSSPTVFR